MKKIKRNIVLEPYQEEILEHLQKRHGKSKSELMRITLDIWTIIACAKDSKTNFKIPESLYEELCLCKKRPRPSSKELVKTIEDVSFYARGAWESFKKTHQL